ncbi:MAG: MMPL family transporter [Planctomycetia bacterium]|nr:MMPL family transporter [Planctomycetia bacterium]
MQKDFFKKYGFRILFIVVFLLSFIWMGTRATIESNSNSVEDWLPNKYQETRDYKWFLEHFPFESFVVVSWDGCTLTDDRVEMFAQKLVPEQTIDNFSLMTPSGEVRADLDVREIHDKIQQELLEERQKEQTGGPIAATPEAVGQGGATPEASAVASQEPDYFKSVMTGPRLVRLLELAYQRTPQMNLSPEELRQEIVNRLRGTLVGPDGESTALIVTLEQGKRDGKTLKKVLDRIRAISVECGMPNTIEVTTGGFGQKVVQGMVDMGNELVNGRQPRLDGVIMGGPPTDNVALDQEGERTLYRLAGLCAVIGGTLAYACLHSIRLTMFVFWVSILSAGVAMMTVSLTGGTCDSILLSMPALVYVLAMSGAIHMINYYHDAIREHGLQNAPERALEHAFSPCFFAQLTTALGLGSLFVSELIPITKFGFYSAIGVMTTLLLLFLYLPALLYFYPSTKFAAKYAHVGLDADPGLMSRFWGYVGGYIIKYHNLVAGLCFGVMVFLAFNLTNIKTSVKMMAFFSPDADIIANYNWLEGHLGPLVPMEVVVSFDNKRLDRNTYGTASRLSLINHISERLQEDLAEDVGGTLSVGMFAPDIDLLWEPESIAHRMAASVISKSIDENRAALKDYLAIEGNPSLDEMLAWLEARDQGNKTLLADLKEQLSSDMAAENFSLDEALAYLKRENSALPEAVDSEPVAEDESVIEGEPEPAWKDSTFAARVQNYVDKENEFTAFSALAAACQQSKKTLLDAGITDLTTILADLPTDREWHGLTRETLTALHQGARLWQEHCGIELWRISIRVWALKKDIDYSKFVTDVRNVIEPILAAESDSIQATIGPEGGSAEAAGSEAPVDAAYLRETAVASGLSAPNPDATAGGDSMRSDPAHAHDTVYPAGLSAKYTGMVPLVYKTQHELINGLVESLIMAFFLISITLMFVLRSVPGGLVAMIPNLFPVVCVFGYMGWQQILVDVGTMMTASVALGVAIDDTMHYLTWYSDGIHKGQAPKVAALNAYKRCAVAMTESTIICGLGLFAFAFSTFVPTQKFGILMLTILFVAEVGDLIFLPALLTGPLGRYFVLKKRRKFQPEDMAKNTEAIPVLANGPAQEGHVGNTTPNPSKKKLKNHDAKARA